MPGTVVCSETTVIKQLDTLLVECTFSNRQMEGDSFLGINTPGLC